MQMFCKLIQEALQPQVPALLDCIEQELAAEEAGLALGPTTADAPYGAAFAAGAPAARLVPSTPAAGRAGPAAGLVEVSAPREGDAMSPERSVRPEGRQVPPTPARTPVHLPRINVN